MKTISFIFFVILKVCLCCNDPERISFMEPFNDVQSIQSMMGEDLNIICCHPDGADNLLWKDVDNREIAFKNNNGVFTLKDEKNRLILRIDNFDPNKIGEYKCINKLNNMIKTIILTARETSLKPEIKKIYLHFAKNKPIIIKCSLKYNQVLKHWIFSRGNKNVVVNKIGQGKGYVISDDKKVFKIIPDGKHEDIKMVWCQYQEVEVNGDVKTGLQEFIMNFYDPIDVKLTIDHKGPIFESNNVKLVCSFKPNDQISVEFPNNAALKPNMFINNEGFSKGIIILTINKITKDLEGEYGCKISKFLSIEPMVVVEETEKIKLDVIIPPYIITNDFVTTSAKLNDKVYFNCQIKTRDILKENVYFEHYNRDSSSWKRLSKDKKYSVNFTNNDISVLSLIIKNVTWEDRGKYKCVAKNIAGEDSKIDQFKIEKAPELNKIPSVIHMATKPVKITCSVSGYPMSSSEDQVTLIMLNQTSSFDINLIDKQLDDLEGITVEYEVKFKGELIEGSYFQLQCLYKNMRTNSVQQKNIVLKFAQKPKVPEVEVICSGSSGIAFKYKIWSSDDTTMRMVRHVLSYAPSEEFEALSKKPLKVIITKEDEKNEYMVYVLRDLMASRKYTFKWESFNIFSLSNELTLTYNTKDVLPPPTPKAMQFSTKGNMINVNVSWNDDCPYSGSNSDIRDITINVKPVKYEEGKNSNWQWNEKNFTLDTDTSSAQFLIYLDNPQIDYEIEVALRSPQGTSESLTSIYKADMVLTGSLFSCFPRCTGNSFSNDLRYVHCTIALVFLILLIHFN